MYLFLYILAMIVASPHINEVSWAVELLFWRYSTMHNKRCVESKPTLAMTDKRSSRALRNVARCCIFSVGSSFCVPCGAASHWASGIWYTCRTDSHWLRVLRRSMIWGWGNARRCCRVYCVEPRDISTFYVTRSCSLSGCYLFFSFPLGISSLFRLDLKWVVH